MHRTDATDPVMKNTLRVSVLVAAIAPFQPPATASSEGPTAAPSAAAAVPASAAAVCGGAGYADDFSALSVQARDYDRHPEASFSYCTRNTAVYECLSYGADGGIRRQRRTAVLHGTAFAYRRQGGDTLLLTNDHVGSWPAVTDAQHAVDGIPAGCKRVSESLALVDDEHDDYARDDVPVARVVTDPQLDVAVLKAHADLHVMPWKVGRSAALRERNVVEVRGFPLGAFRATNLGKVISEHDHDDYGDWDHDDFVIDALLSAGNSGSPVLAVSCATGEYELVGIFHAGYTQGSALNVVVGIDQVRDLMSTLKRTPHEHVADAPPMDGATRAGVDAAAARARGQGTFFPFGGNVAAVRAGAGGTGALLFALYARDFPQVAEPIAVVEDLPPSSPSRFGEVGRVWFGTARGLKRVDPAQAEGDTAAQVARLVDALRADAAAAIAYRRDARQESSSRQTSQRLVRVAQSLARTAASRADLVQAVADAAERLGPQAGEPATLLVELPSPGDGAAPALTVVK
jgi:serine protease Do